jgi:hypothetical protein
MKKFRITLNEQQHQFLCQALNSDSLAVAVKNAAVASQVHAIVMNATAAQEKFSEDNVGTGSYRAP